MEFEWDEEKRAANFQKHRIDFAMAEIMFDGRPTSTSSSDRFGEERFLTVALVEHRFLTVIWTPRHGKCRVISLRGARNAEKRTYRELHGG
jgi:uncharacterized DUF497 family protein